MFKWCGASYFRGAIMRKITVFAAGIIIAAAALDATGAAAESQREISQDVSEQVILRLLYQPTAAAIEDYYGEPRQQWRPEILSVQKVAESTYYEVIIRTETFYGAHNPPYGLETMTFYVDPLGQVQLVSFDHQDRLD